MQYPPITNNPAYQSPEHPDLVIPESLRVSLPEGLTYQGQLPESQASNQPSHSESDAPQTENNHRLRTLTALRFITAALIVLDHFQAVFWNDRNFGLFPDFAPAVSFFFMLSGFVLCHSYLERQPEGTFSFLSRRFARLWPLHVVMAIFTLVMLPPLNETLWKMPMPALTIAANLALLQSWIPLEAAYFSMNAVSWSLSTLMAFYLVFPFTLRHIQRLWPLQLLAASLLTVGMLFLGSRFPLFDQTHITGQAFIYISPLCRFLEFFLGMLSALLVIRAQQSYPANRLVGTFLEGVVLVNVLLFMGPARAWVDTVKPFSNILGKSVFLYLYTAGLTLIPLFLFITVFAMARGKLSSLLAHPAFVFLGELSFGIYLIHVPLIHYYLYPVMAHPHALSPSFERLVTYAVLLIGLSYLSSRLFEKPLNSLMRLCLRKS